MGNVDWPVRLIFNSITWKKKKKRTVTGKFKKNSTKKKQIYDMSDIYSDIYLCIQNWAWPISAVAHMDKPNGFQRKVLCSDKINN